MLRIAIPNKGTLSTPAAQMLRDAGYRQRTDPKDLVCRDEIRFIGSVLRRSSESVAQGGSHPGSRLVTLVGDRDPVINDARQSLSGSRVRHPHLPSAALPRAGRG